jgi:hypothetical protein
MRELGRLLPGPPTRDPRDKIFRYLAREYGFDMRTLWSFSIDDMKLYIEARPPRQERPVDATKEDWRPASEAVVIAAEKGYDITLDWVSKHKKKFRTRPRQLPGRHQLEVEMGSLAVVLFAEAGRSGREPEGDQPGQLERDRIEARKRAEHDHKRNRLS